MNQSSNSQTIAELIKEVLNFLDGLQYSKRYINDIRRRLEKFQEYCKQNDELYYTVELSERFLAEKHGIANTVNLRNERRAMDILTEYQKLGMFSTRRSTDRCIPKQFEECVDSYLQYMKCTYKRAGTIQRHRRILLKFTTYLHQAKVQDISEINVENINQHYIKHLGCGYSKSYVKDNVNVIKSFTEFLYKNHVISENVADKLLKVHIASAPLNLPNTFSEDDLEKIINAIDQESPIGKRDYAAILLAAKLGLRTSDIKNLKPSNIDWAKNEISIIQVKTQKPLTIPLPKDVGWALINYMKNGRPPSDAKEIFLRHMPPHIPIENFNWMLSKYMRLAGLTIDKTKHHGFHTLRYTLATNMLNQDIPLTDIQAVLGHSTPESTKGYIKIDVAQLAECSLEVPSDDA